MDAFHIQVFLITGNVITPASVGSFSVYSDDNKYHCLEPRGLYNVFPF